MSVFEILPNQNDVIRLVQITDSHIFSEASGKLLGLNTRESFEAVFERINKEEWRADILLATGDLSQDASPESYQYLTQRFVQSGIQSFWLSGNHDDPDVMMEHMNEKNVSPAKLIHAGNWQIILLDSSVRDHVHGELSVDELNFLEQALSNYKDKNTIIGLHHQPVSVDCDWIDKIGLKNANELKAIVSRHKQVKAVFWGHIHQRYHQKIEGVEWIATPSTCVQFRPKSKEFSAGEEAPGYRYFYLYPDGRFETVLHRIDTLEYTVDYTVKGY